MAWIESNQELANHPKTKRFARMAGISIPAAIGHLHLLWWWALDYAQDGDLTTMEPEDIADAILWDGDPDKVVRALIDSKFIDYDAGTSRIHDWMEYAGRLIDKRRANTERKRKSRDSHARQAQDKEETKEGQTEDVTGTTERQANESHDGHGATVHNSTVPNLTEQEREKMCARLLTLFNALRIKGGGALGLDKVYSFIGVAEEGLIEQALKAAEGKHVNYFVSTLNDWITERKSAVSPMPVANGGDKQTKQQRELDALELLREEAG